MKTNGNAFNTFLLIVITFGLVLSGCSPKPTAAPISTPTTIPPTDTIIPTPTQTATVTATPVPLSPLTLKPGDLYFRLDGKPTFIFSRNLAGFKPDDYNTLLNWAHTGGTLLVRVGTDNSSMGGDWGYGYTNNGEINDGWSNNWEHFFDEAETNGIYVLPFFTGWENWNTSVPNTWSKNPFNSINGGPAKDPTEIFRKDSPTQKLYLEWFKKVVTRWQKHQNIAAWEVITEVNNINGITEPDGVYLFDQLAGVARAADPQQRPISASLADIGKGDWTSFYSDKALDILDYHPYPYTATLDLSEKLLSDVARLRVKYNKPIIIGESGLNALPPDDKLGSGNLPNAHIGIEHAIWTEIVSGTMNGRALFWEDSFGMYFTSLGWPYLQKYTDIERPAANFTNGIDFSGFQPLKSTISSDIWGATIGNDKMVLGWYRDASSVAPNWSMKPEVSKQTVTITVLGSAANWQVDFYNSKDGTTILSSVAVSRKGSAITIPLPDFQDDIAFKLYPK
jgi:hypothetical protein